MTSTILEHIPWGNPDKAAEKFVGLGRLLAASRRHRLAIAAFGALAVCFAVVGLASLGRAAFGDANRELSLFGGGLFLTMSLVVGFVLWRRSIDLIAVFEYGVAVRTAKGVELVPWTGIRTVFAEVVDLVGDFTRRPRDCYRIVMMNGVEVLLDGEYERHREVGHTLCAALGQSRFASCSAIVRSGQVVSFGAIAVSAWGIHVNGHVVPFAQVLGMERDLSFFKSAPIVMFRTPAGTIRVKEQEIADPFGCCMVLAEGGVRQIASSVYPAG